jgi:hypothetical protein
MLATILGFSYLVLMGFRRLGVGLTREAEEDYWYVWRVFAHCMGLDAAWLPDDVDDACAFYAGSASASPRRSTCASCSRDRRAGAPRARRDQPRHLPGVIDRA